MISLHTGDITPYPARSQPNNNPRLIVLHALFGVMKEYKGPWTTSAFLVCRLLRGFFDHWRFRNRCRGRRLICFCGMLGSMRIGTSQCRKGTFGLLLIDHFFFINPQLSLFLFLDTILIKTSSFLQWPDTRIGNFRHNIQFFKHAHIHNKGHIRLRDQSFHLLF